VSKPNVIRLTITARQARAVAEWLRASKPNERRLTIMDDDEDGSELLARLRLEGQLDKAAIRKRGRPQFDLPLDRPDARRLVKWGMRYDPVFGLHTDRRAPGDVRHMIRLCLEALAKRRGNPGWKIVLRGRALDYAILMAKDERHVQRLRARRRLSAWRRRRAAVKGSTTALS
jgi:hypothetical protein